MLLTVFCPICPAVMSTRIPDNRVGQTLLVQEQNVGGNDVDHYNCPQCERVFQVSYKVDQVVEIKKKGAFKHDCGNGYIAVPRDAVSINGHYFERLNDVTPDFNGPYVLLMPPHLRTAMAEDGRRPYRYSTLQECIDDAKTLHKHRDER